MKGYMHGMELVLADSPFDSLSFIAQWVAMYPSEVRHMHDLSATMVLAHAYASPLLQSQQSAILHGLRFSPGKQIITQT